VQTSEPHLARFADLDTTTLYALLKLRVDVFVVEQGCAYPDLDGRDAEPDTRHLWITGPAGGGTALGGAGPQAYLRLLTDPDGTARIGRVCTAPAARGQGLAGRLVVRALAEIGRRPCVLHAQSPLVDYYRRYGFRPVGPEFLDEGVPHIPMRRD
jgi:ElaA protein